MGTAKFGRDRGRCSKIAGVTIPHCNSSQSATCSLFVSSSTIVPTKKRNPFFKGEVKFGEIGISAAKY